MLPYVGAMGKDVSPIHLAIELGLTGHALRILSGPFLSAESEIVRVNKRCFAFRPFHTLNKEPFFILFNRIDFPMAADSIRLIRSNQWRWF